MRKILRQMARHAMQAANLTKIHKKRNAAGNPDRSFFSKYWREYLDRA